MRGFGIFSIVFGAVLALIALNMNVTVSTAYGTVNNIGLMADRQNYLLFGVGAAIVGALLAIFGGKRGQAEAITPAIDNTLRKCPHCAELIKKEAHKCKHCGSGVEVWVEVVPPLPHFFERPDGMSIGEYQELFVQKYDARRIANGFHWRGTDYHSFGELTAAVQAAVA